MTYDRLQPTPSRLPKRQPGALEKINQILMMLEQQGIELIEDSERISDARRRHNTWNGSSRIKTQKEVQAGRT